MKRTFIKCLGNLICSTLNLSQNTYSVHIDKSHNCNPVFRKTTSHTRSAADGTYTLHRSNNGIKALLKLHFYFDAPAKKDCQTPSSSNSSHEKVKAKKLRYWYVSWIQMFLVGFKKYDVLAQFDVKIILMLIWLSNYLRLMLASNDFNLRIWL